MPETATALDVLRDTLAATRLATEAAFDPTKLDAVRAELMKPYNDPDGRWRHAPRQAKVDALQAIEREQRAQQDQALGELEATVARMTAVLDPAIAAARQAPDPLAAFADRYKGYGRGDEVQLAMLRELVTARLERERATATPAAMLAAYTAALGGITSTDPIIVQWVERTYAGGWQGAGSGPEDVTAARQLAKRIAETQDGRVPTALRDRAQQLTEARRYAKRLRTLIDRGAGL